MIEGANGEMLLVTLENGVPVINFPAVDPVGNSTVLVDNSTLVDLEASNGIVQGIDTVLLPESALFNIIELASTRMDEFGTFVTLVAAAGLTEALEAQNTTNPLTVFSKLPLKSLVMSSLLVHHLHITFLHHSSYQQSLHEYSQSQQMLLLKPSWKK